MTNPDHGMMPVYDTGEVERAQKCGWSLLNVGESPQVPVINGDESHTVADVIDAEKALKEALTESMRLDPPDNHVALLKKAITETFPPLVLPVVSEPPKRKPGRPRKGE